MKNEVLCKLLAHNLCVLIQSQAELGIEPLFWTDETPVEKAAPVQQSEGLAVCPAPVANASTLPAPAPIAPVRGYGEMAAASKYAAYSF